MGSNCPGNYRAGKGLIFKPHTGLNKALKSRSYLSGGSYQEQEHMEGEEEEEEEVKMSQNTEARGETNNDSAVMTNTVSIYKVFIILLRVSHTRVHL